MFAKLFVERNFQNIIQILQRLNAIMLTKPKTNLKEKTLIENETLSILQKNKEIYQLIAPFSNEAEEVMINLNAHFSVSEWGKINWSDRQDSLELLVKNHKQTIKGILRICKYNQLYDDNIFILWSHTAHPIIHMNLNRALKYLKYILLEDIDIWLISSSFKWCIEIYHETEMSFGYHLENSR